MITINKPETRDTHPQDLSLEFVANETKICIDTTIDSWSSVSSSLVGPDLEISSFVSNLREK